MLLPRKTALPPVHSPVGGALAMPERAARRIVRVARVSAVTYILEHMFEHVASRWPLCGRSPYSRDMAVSAHDVARALRARLPGIGSVKLQKLLYYCQGHHLAATGEPLFVEPLSAWDNGPVVGHLWHAENVGEPEPAPRDLTEGQLNTVGYVCSRYGGLTSTDLINMSHQESPWRRANADRPPGGHVRIQLDWLRAYFSDEGAPGDEDEPVFAPEQRAQMLAIAAQRQGKRSKPDAVEDILARLRARA